MDGSLPETNVSGGLAPPGRLENPGNPENLSRPECPDLEEVLALCTLLEEHRGGDVAALDLRDLHSWTDFFIIATVQSGAHLQGMLRHIKDFAADRGLTLFRTQGKSDDNGGWNLVDMGTAVIHLMTAPVREFYELEELWSSAGRIFPVSSTGG